MNKEIDRYYFDFQIGQKRVYYRKTIFVTSKPLLAETVPPSMIGLGSTIIKRVDN